QRQHWRADGERFAIAIHDVAAGSDDGIEAHGARVTLTLEFLVVQDLQVDNLPGHHAKECRQHREDAGQSPDGLMFLSYLADHRSLSLFRTMVFSSSGTSMSSCDLATSSTFPCATRLLCSSKSRPH